MPAAPSAAISPDTLEKVEGQPPLSRTTLLPCGPNTSADDAQIQQKRICDLPDTLEKVKGQTPISRTTSLPLQVPQGPDTDPVTVQCQQQPKRRM